MATKEKSRPDIMFSELPLELKKQFLHHLVKNGVDFQRTEDNKFLQAKVKLIEDASQEKRITVPSSVEKSKSKGRPRSDPKTNSMRHFAKHSNQFHQACVYSPWEQKRISNNRKLDQDLK